MSERVLEDGGEVYVEQYDDCRVYDRIILTDGFAVCINKKAYEQDIYPQDKIEVISALTMSLEDEDWW